MEKLGFFHGRDRVIYGKLKISLVERALDRASGTPPHYGHTRVLGRARGVARLVLVKAKKIKKYTRF